MAYRCDACDCTDLPAPADLARLVASISGASASEAEWWIVLAPWAVIQANAIVWMIHRDLRCYRHAALVAAIGVDFLQRMGDGRELVVPLPDPFAESANEARP